jgi:dipeptidyl aminopeptidase/acylaminoacyl peptidase
MEASGARMARIGVCYSASFSPDGSRIAFNSDLGGIPQVWTVASEGGWPQPVTALEDPVHFLHWSPDGSTIAFTVAPGGGMNEQIYTVRPDGTGLRRLTDGGKETNRLGRWTHDGTTLMLASNRRDATTMDAYLVEAATAQFSLVAETRGVGGLTDVSRDGRRAVLNRQASRGDEDLFLLDLPVGREVRLTPHEGPGSSPNGRFSPDGRTVYLSSNAGRDLAAFARVALGDDGRPGPIEVLAAREDAELAEFAIDESGATAALIWNVAGRDELVFFDLATARSTPGPALPAETAGGLRFSRDGRLLAFVASGSVAPFDVWVLEPRSGRLSQVTHSPHPGVDLARLVRPSLVQFKAHDGLALSGWLYRPGGVSGPGPMVLSFHGGPEGQERPMFNATYQALLARGISVFAPNVRGSGGFGKRFVNLDNGPLRVEAVRDIKDCVAHVVEAGVADPKRVGIMGGSYGGFMTLSGLAEYPELFAAGVNLYGLVNFETFFAGTEPWMAAISKVEYGDPATQGDLLRRLSPIRRLDCIRAPVLVLHGANDTNTPVAEADQVVAGLKGRGVPVDYVLFPDEGHGFRKPKNRVRAAVATVRWFAEHLKLR